MRNIALAFVATSLFAATAALAADMAAPYSAPPAPSCSSARWDGFYAGINGCGIVHRSTLNDNGNFPVAVIGASVGTQIDTTSSGIAGGQLGYNVQNCLTVWGIETDLDWTGLKTSYGANSFTAANDYTVGDRMRWFGSTRGRVGIAVENLLLFVTSGVAYASINHSVAANFIPFLAGLNPIGFNDTATQWGWIVGAGAEWSFSNNLSLRSEVLLAGFTDRTHTMIFSPLGGPVQMDTLKSSDDVVMFRAGLDYRFGGGR